MLHRRDTSQCSWLSRVSVLHAITATSLAFVCSCSFVFWFLAMPVTIQHYVSINIGGDISWKVKPCHVITIDGEQFVKITAWDPAFVRMMCEGFGEWKRRSNKTLSSCEGLKQIIAIRNQQDFNGPSGSSGGSSLFPDASPSTTGTCVHKRHKRSAEKIKELRLNPDVMPVTVPGYDDVPPMDVRMVRAVCTSDELIVVLDATALEHVFEFMRHAGVSDEACQTRAYKPDVDIPKGVYRRGDTFVVNVAETSDAKRFRRAKTMQEAIAISNGCEVELGAIGDGRADEVPDQDVDNV